MPARARATILRAASACLLLGAPRAAIAGEPRHDSAPFRWSAPPECPGIDQLRAQIDRLLTNPRARSRATSQVIAEVTRDAGGPYRLRLVITDREGGIRERRIDGETCAEVADAAAVVVALASDEDAPIRAEPPPLPPPSVAEPPERAELPLAIPEVAPPPRPAPPARMWDVTALGGVDFASLPAPAPGLALALALGVGANRFELRGTAWLPQRATLPSRSAVGGDVALYAGALRFCRLLVQGTIDLAPCAGLEAGALVASGVGVASPTSGIGPWLAPELDLTGAVHLGLRLAIAIELDGLVPLARDRFVITRAGQVFQPPPVTGRAVVGLRVRFP